jgi:glycosyltransferase involved in cell wall biosynthesis
LETLRVYPVKNFSHVSIITPSYNQAAFLEQTIQSVLLQDYPDLEYLVVDGGSGDGSVEIIQRHAERLAWWVSEPDRGQAEAINKGLQRAQGEIVAWLNSDDLYLPGTVRQAVAALEANPQLGMVFGDAVTIDLQGRPMNRLAFGDWGLSDLMGFRIICQPAVFMRRSVLEKAGYLDLDYHFMLDHHLWLRMARLAPIQHISEILAAARHHPGAKNVKQAPGFGQETLRLLAWMESDPDWAATYEMDGPRRAHKPTPPKRILGGAYRLNARYLLDGGLYGPALRSYARALWASPAYTLKHWHRILYAAFGWLSELPYGANRPGARRPLSGDQETLRVLKTLRVSWYRRRRPVLPPTPAMEGWPGLLLK